MNLRFLMSEGAIAASDSPDGHGMELLSRSTRVAMLCAPPGDYFPNSMERCVSISGSETDVITFLWNLSVRIPELSASLTLVLPNPCVSIIIGQGGSTIKSLSHASGARIKVEERLPGVKDRLVRVSGPSPEVIFKGIRCMLDRVHSDPSLSMGSDVSYRDQYRMDPVIYQQHLQNYWASVLQSGQNQS